MMHCSAPTRAALQEEAAGFYRQSLEISGVLSQKIAEMRQMRNNINIQGRSLSRQELDFVATADSLDGAFSNWQTAFKPAPGYGPDGRPLPGKLSPRLSKPQARSAAAVQKEHYRELLGILERLNTVFSGR